MKKKSSKNAIKIIFFVALIVQCMNVAAAKTKPDKNRSVVVADINQTSRTITGVVLDIEGAPLPGVNVYVEGTTRGGTTDADGAFNVRVAAEDKTLSFSMIGFQTQIIDISASNTVNVVMRESSLVFDDVVVVGYGTQKKVTVTGAISTINVDHLVAVPTANFANSLGGYLPGIVTRQNSGEPGFDQASIYIRGLSTWTGTQSPLILIDGVERDINLVNPLEIDNFTVLKDASATAVYGVKGANGVILINTKKGIKQAPQVTLRTEWANAEGMRFPNYINGYEFASLMNEASANSGRQLPWTEEELIKFRDHTDPYLYPDVNWTDAVYRKNSLQAVNNLGIRGGDEVVRYYANVGMTSQGGLYAEDRDLPYRTNAIVNRFNFRTNLDVNLYKDLVLDIGLGAIIEKRNYQGTPAGDIFNATRNFSPISTPILNPDGSVAGRATSYEVTNPWALTTRRGYTNMYVNTIQGNFGLKWDLSRLVTPGLSLATKFAFDTRNRMEIFRRIEFGVWQYLGPDPVTGEDRYNTIRNEGSMGSSVDAQENTRSTYWDVSLNYSRTFLDKHTASAMLLFNQQEFINIRATNEIQNIPERRQGLAGRFTYDYSNRYLVEFNFGYNGSEQFPKDRRYGFFPSLSLGWIVSEEDFWNSAFFSNLKLRISRGQVGSDNLSGNRFLYLTTINKNSNGYWFGPGSSGTGAGYAEAQIGAANVTWERSTKTNGGFDIGLWKNRLSLQVDLFYENRDNILVQRQIVPDYVGFVTTPWGNVGKTENKGIDGMLEFRNQTAKGFYYSFRSNFTFARNKILDNDQPVPLWDYQSRVGHRIGQQFVLNTIGIFQSEEEIASSPKQTFMDVVRPGDLKYEDRNGDGVIDSYDSYAIGYSDIPEMMFGFGGTIAWKGFDFTIFFTGVANRTNIITGAGIQPFSLEYPSYNIYREYYDKRWIPGAADNSSAKYPAAIAGQNPNSQQSSTTWQFNGTYLKLQNAEIGYTLPADLTKKVHISKARFFANGTHLYIWDYMKFVDPEVSGHGVYPKQRIINVGLQVDF